MEAWWEAYHPDAVITLDDQVEAVLEKMGVRVPKDVGLIHLDRNRASADWSGIQAREKVQIRLAENRLVDLLNRSHEQPQEMEWNIRVPGDWCEGRTLQPKHPVHPPHRTAEKLSGNGVIPVTAFVILQSPVGNVLVSRRDCGITFYLYRFWSP